MSKRSIASLTTSEINDAGFTNVVIFDLNRWRAKNDNPLAVLFCAEKTAAQELQYVLGLPLEGEHTGMALTSEGRAPLACRARLEWDP